MARGTFQLKSRELIKKYGQNKSLYQIAKDGDLTYSTIHRWQDVPEDVQAVKLDVLFSFLMGLGLTAQDIESLPFGEVFDIKLNDAA